MAEKGGAAGDQLTKQHYPAIVVGSGFGGAVAACRLAQAGIEVAVLERGRRFPPGKNSLDLNYLAAAEQHGAEVLTRTEVTHISAEQGPTASISSTTATTGENDR